MPCMERERSSHCFCCFHEITVGRSMGVIQYDSGISRHFVFRAERGGRDGERNRVGSTRRREKREVLNVVGRWVESDVREGC